MPASIAEFERRFDEAGHGDLWLRLLDFEVLGLRQNEWFEAERSGRRGCATATGQRRSPQPSK